MHRFVYFLLLSYLLIGSVFGTEKSHSDRRVYINANQLFIDQEGMYVILDQQTLIPLKNLFHDGKGFSILEKDFELSSISDRYTCPNGHPAPLGQGRCNNPNCPYVAH